VSGPVIDHRPRHIRTDCATMDAHLKGVLAGYGIAIPVGAISVLIVQVGIRPG